MAVTLFIVGDILVQLLRIHNRVSLPGIGAFVAEYQPAAIIKGGKVMTPPMKSVVFRTDELWNDGFLETALSEREMIPLDEVKRQLTAFTDELHTLLKEGERVEFPDFGTMRITADGDYYFEKDEDVNLLSDAFGLQELDVIPLFYEAPPTNSNPTTRPMSGATGPKIVEPILSPLTPIALPRKKKKCTRICWILLALVFITVAGFTLRSIYVFYRDQADLETLLINRPTTSFTERITEDAPADSAALQPTKNDDATDTLANNWQDSTLTKPMNRYHIILDAYVTEESAKVAMDKKTSPVGSNYILLHTAGALPYRVSAFRCQSISEANERLLTLKKTDAAYERAWVEKY